MKLKYYLRGLGLGIIFTSIIFAVAYSQNKGLTTDSEVMKRASELGMVSTETESTGLFDQEETENFGSETEGEVQTPPDSQVDTQESQQEQTTLPEVQTSQQEDTSQQAGEQESQQEQTAPQESQVSDSQQNSERTEDAEPEYVVITVQKGEVCRQIAEDLQAHGLVDDAESFRKYMQEKDYDNLIRVGSIPIKKGATYEEIAIALTTKQ